MLLTIAMALWATNLLILLLLAIAILLILTVLIQRPQGGGLSAAFGSAGSGQTAFGTKTGDALTVFTVIMFTLFVLVAIGLNFAMRPSGPPAPPIIESSTPGTETTPATEPSLTPEQAPGQTPADGVVENPAVPTVPGTTPGTPPGTTPEVPPATDPAPAGEQPAPTPTPAPEQPSTPPADPSNAPK